VRPILEGLIGGFVLLRPPDSGPEDQPQLEDDEDQEWPEDRELLDEIVRFEPGKVHPGRRPQRREEDQDHQCLQSKPETSHEIPPLEIPAEPGVILRGDPELGFVPQR
jgi:hypothetical protein